MADEQEWGPMCAWYKAQFFLPVCLYSCGHSQDSIAMAAATAPWQPCRTKNAARPAMAAPIVAASIGYRYEKYNLNDGDWSVNPNFQGLFLGATIQF